MGWLGLAVVGGPAFSQIITLCVTPVFYTYLDDFQRRVRRKPAAPRHTTRGEVAEAVKTIEVGARG
jgi:HAE1 family hydrophobic/amphiphilic exporter-1